MVDVEKHPGVLIVTVRESRIDAAVAVRFKDAMQAATGRDRAPRVVLDLAAVQFLDSSGLGAVVGAMKQLDSDRRLELASLQPNVAKVFSLTRMDRIFPIHADRTVALHSGSDGAIANAS